MTSGLLGVVILSTPLLAGCTLIGAGVGSGVPSWERVPPQKVGSLKQGSELEVDADRLEGTPVRDASARAERPAPSARRTVRGNYLGIHSGALVIDSSSGVAVAPLESTRSVRQQTGSYWWAGALAGAAVDIVVVLAAAAAMSDIGPDGRMNVMGDGHDGK